MNHSRLDLGRSGVMPLMATSKNMALNAVTLSPCYYLVPCFFLDSGTICLFFFVWVLDISSLAFYLFLNISSLVIFWDSNHYVNCFLLFVYILSRFSSGF